MKKISLKDVKKGLKRDEMRSIQGGGCGSPTCKKSCVASTINSECCSGATASGTYPPCPNSNGARVCI